MTDIAQFSDPDLEAATAIYAIGDIHGRRDLLEAMHAAILADVRQTRPDRPLICYLGDYIDRGPESAGVIARLAAPWDEPIARVFLKGNHEDRMLAFLEAPGENGPAWVKFGGREALESYGVTVPDELSGAHWDGLRDQLRDRLPVHHRQFLESLRLALRWRGYLFVHAGLHPDKALNDQSAHDLMWIREPFLSASRDWGMTVVHGHVIAPEVVFRPNRIGIDTGAYKSGRLSCLVVGSDAPRVLTATL